MAAKASFSIVALSPLGSGAIWQTIVKRVTLVNETFVQRVRHASSQGVKEDLRIFHENVGWLSLLRRSIFPFSYVAPPYPQLFVTPRAVHSVVLRSEGNEKKNKKKTQKQVTEVKTNSLALY